MLQACAGAGGDCIPDGCGDVVGTAADDVADVLGSRVDRQGADDAAARWRCRRRRPGRRPVDERTGGTEPDVQLAELVRVLRVTVIAKFHYTDTDTDFFAAKLR